MKIFLDSSFIIALILERDTLHEKAVLLKERGIFNQDCYISNLIINEVITVVGSRTDKEIAKLSYHFLKDNCILIENKDTVKLNDKTMDTYLQYNVRLSFTDSNIVELMKENNIKQLASFDRYLCDSLGPHFSVIQCDNLLNYLNPSCVRIFSPKTSN